jgi:uncharacterized membrane protein YphA (DoxX/SURF4 family)
VTAVTVARRASLRRSLHAVITSVGSLRAILVLRALMGAVVIRHLWPDVRASVLPVERFHVPWWSWLPVPSPGAYRVLLWIGVLAGLAMIVGVAARAATATALAVVAYLLVVDMTGFAHNRGFLVWVLVGLVLLPHRPVGVLWPVVLLRVVVSAVYLTSGLTKLVNPDWSSGLVLWDRVTRHADRIPFDGWAHDLLTSRAFHHVLSPAAIAVELFLGVGLWFRRTRLAALWLAVAFHASIEVAASVQTFSYTAIAALLLWVTPAERQRELRGGSEALRRAVRRLDWLHRFRIGDGGGDGAGRPGDPVFLVDVEGTERRGRDATLTALSRLPIAFPFVAPLLALHRGRTSALAARR